MKVKIQLASLVSVVMPAYMYAVWNRPSDKISGSEEIIGGVDGMAAAFQESWDMIVGLAGVADVGFVVHAGEVCLITEDVLVD
jgi:hypothetical protein